MQVDFTGIGQITKAERIKDDGGTFVDLHFANGARLRIGAENDTVVFWKDGSADQNPYSAMFCDMGAGMHAPGAPTDFLFANE